MRKSSKILSLISKVSNIKVRVKKARGRKLSSTRWIYRHLNDEYVQKTNKDSYRSRSAYKLIEIDNKFKLLQKGKRIIDLGASPGGWSQIASQKGANIFAVDIKPMDPIDGVEYIKCNIISGLETLIEKFKGYKFDVVLSDMAPKSCGLKSLDHARTMLLCEAAFDLVKHLLNREGKFVVKIFQGESDKNFSNELKKMFKTVRYFKPKSSRSESTEMYLVSLGFTGGN